MGAKDPQGRRTGRKEGNRVESGEPEGKRRRGEKSWKLDKGGGKIGGTISEKILVTGLCD